MQKAACVYSPQGKVGKEFTAQAAMYAEAYKNPEIDLADIWLEEQHRYQESGKDKSFYDDLYRYFQPFYIQFGQPPFITAEMVARDPSQRTYYQSYFTRLARKEETLLDFFERDGSFYDMERSCVLKKEAVPEDLFRKFFALKLRHFEEGLFYLYPFLQYHLTESFAKDKQRYGEFLEDVLHVHNDLVPASVQKNVKAWLTLLFKNQYASQKTQWNSNEEHEEVPPPNNNETVRIIPIDAVNSDERTSTNKEQGNATREETIVLPPGYRRIKGRCTDDEARAYFFELLCKRHSPPEGPFATEEDVNRMFRYGLALPPEPLTEKMSLRFTKRYPKYIVDHGIYFFIQQHAPAHEDEVIAFFAMQVTDYEGTLTQTGLGSLKSNYAKQKAQSKHFDYESFLPDRLKLVPKHKPTGNKAP